MTTEPATINEVYRISNMILSKMLKNKFGSQYSMRLNSIIFFSNRLTILNSKYVEQVSIKSLKPMCFEELQQVQKFLLSKLNTILICTELDFYNEVREVKMCIL